MESRRQLDGFRGLEGARPGVGNRQAVRRKWWLQPWLGHRVETEESLPRSPTLRLNARWKCFVS